MIDIISKSGKRIGRISDSISQDDILFIDGKPISLTDVYTDPEIMKKLNAEIKGSNNGIKITD